ncbi:hypothetical protein [Thiobacillus sp.]|uniref:hypothetical protein n=1 Tax=Thiobacillus sp. TaxID=924 RepID=UPI00184E6CB6|nr:hypothetical protein [Thiobacillus sp.]MBC2732649.1 hypothetical protein [Thiobacillus sp.]MBC2741386.1 hypothetical protein [Thiobacillus sp.]MBC2759022.1 hypothetical protein [Thiobacillus sp.]
MNGWLWHLLQWGRRLGPAGLVGLGLLVIALLLQTIQVASLQKTTRTQQIRLAALQQAAARRAAAPQLPPPVNPLSLLPPTGEAAQLIGELERLARLHGLELPRGQYSVSSLTGTSLQRWQLVLPVKTAYPDLHAFLATALERLPNLTLDEVKLKRERIESAELQAELRMSLFVEAAP